MKLCVCLREFEVLGVEPEVRVSFFGSAAPVGAWWIKKTPIFDESRSFLARFWGPGLLIS